MSNIKAMASKFGGTAKPAAAAPAAPSQATSSSSVSSGSAQTIEGQFTEAELKEYRAHFDSFDTNHDGFVVPEELKGVLQNLNMYESMDQVHRLIDEVDKNKNGKVEFSEFLDIVANLKAGKTSNFTKVYSKQKELIQMKTATGTHTYAEEEMSAFAEHLNMCLQGDADCKHLLPIDPHGLDLCKKVSDGILLAKFINIAVKDTIDPRVLNKPKSNRPLQVFQITENQNVVLNSAKAIGVKVTNIGAPELIQGERSPHIVLGLVWQLVKIHMLNSINLKNHPELARLLEQGETINDLLRLPPDQLLLRWFNYHLVRAKHKKIANFSSDVKDSDAYTTLLHQIAPNMCSLAPLEEKDVVRRAGMVLNNSSKLGVKTAIKDRDIASGNARLNLVYTAAIFNTCPGLEPLTQEEVKKCGLLEDDFGDSREERAFRMWINSLGIEDLHINSLYEDCKDGVVLLKVIDHVVPGTVVWKKVNNPATSHFKRLENDNYAVLLGKTLKFSLVGISGADFADGNKKLLLAFVWQLMRLHCLRFLASLAAKKFGGKPVTDDMLVTYANELVQKGGRSTRMASFQDKSLSTGLFFLDLMHVTNTKIIDWDLVQAGDTAEQKLNNAKYCISVARKLGATIFLLPEDIVDVKHKMILTFVAALIALSAA